MASIPSNTALAPPAPMPTTTATTATATTAPKNNSKHKNKTVVKASGTQTKAKKPSQRKKPSTSTNSTNANKSTSATAAQTAFHQAKAAQADLARQKAQAEARRTDPLWYRMEDIFGNPAGDSFSHANNGTTTTTSSSSTVLPEQAQVVEQVLATYGLGPSDVTPQAMTCLLEQSRRFANEIIANAQDFAFAAHRTEVGEADLKLAAKMRPDFRVAVSAQIPKLNQLAQHINRAPLPPIPSHCYASGGVLPPKEHQLTARTYDVVSGARVQRKMVHKVPQAPKRKKAVSAAPSYGATKGRPISIALKTAVTGTIIVNNSHTNNNNNNNNTMAMEVVASPSQSTAATTTTGQDVEGMDVTPSGPVAVAGENTTPSAITTPVDAGASTNHPVVVEPSVVVVEKKEDESSTEATPMEEETPTVVPAVDAPSGSPDMERNTNASNTSAAAATMIPTTDRTNCPEEDPVPMETTTAEESMVTIAETKDHPAEATLELTNEVQKEEETAAADSESTPPVLTDAAKPGGEDNRPTSALESDPPNNDN